MISKSLRSKLKKSSTPQKIFQKKISKHFSRKFSRLFLATVNLILIRILRLSKQQRNNLIRGEKQQRKRRDGDDVTRMLIITVLVHIVCHLHSPFAAAPIAEFVFGQHYVASHAYRIQLAVNNALTLTSHAITFFLVSALFAATAF